MSKSKLQTSDEKRIATIRAAESELKIFAEKVRDEILGKCAVGLHVDGFGGAMFYAYRLPTGDTKGWADSAVQQELSDHKEVAKKLLPEVRRIYTYKALQAVSHALDNLAHELVGEIYAEARKTHEFKRVESTPYIIGDKGRIVKYKFNDGVLERKRLKQLKAGREKGSKNLSPKYSRAKLETYVRSFARVQHRPPNMSESAKALQYSDARTLRKAMRDRGETRRWEKFMSDILDE